MTVVVIVVAVRSGSFGARAVRAVFTEAAGVFGPGRVYCGGEGVGGGCNGSEGDWWWEGLSRPLGRLAREHGGKVNLGGGRSSRCATRTLLLGRN